MRIQRKSRLPRRRGAQQGVALIMALVVLFILSVLGAGVMFSTQTEMWNSANLRTSTQARYVSEAGLTQALNWLNNSSTFSFSSIGPSIIASCASYNTVPLTCSNSQLVLSNISSIPDTWSTMATTLGNSTFTSQDTSFKALTSGSSSLITNLPAGGSFQVAAQLLQVNQVTTGIYRSKWKLVSIGTVPGVSGSASSVQTEEVVETTQYTSGTGSGSPMFHNAITATGTGCNAVYLNGGGTTGSYDSTKSTPGSIPSNSYQQGDIASNGTVSVSNGFYVGGKLYSSITGVNSGQAYYPPKTGNPVYWGTGNNYGGGLGCDASHSYALTQDNSGSAVTGGLVTSGSISQYSSCWTQSGSCPSGYNTYVSQTLPATPNAAITVAANDTNCTADGACGNGSINWNAPHTGTWNPSGGTGSTHEQILSSGAYAFSLAPSDTVNYGNVTPPSSNLEIHLTPGTYNFNSLTLSGSDKIVVDLPSSCTGVSTNTSGCRVVVNLVGKQNTSDVVLNVNGGSITNNTGRPGNLVFQYNGAGQIDITAGAAMFAGIYAPNAQFVMSGGTGLYGAVVAKTVRITNPNGSTPMVDFDTSLLNDGPTLPGAAVPTVTSFHVDEFSWSAF